MKTRLTIADLPFETKYSAEYLRLYYLQNFNEYDFDKQNTLANKESLIQSTPNTCMHHKFFECLIVINHFLYYNLLIIQNGNFEE